MNLILGQESETPSYITYRNNKSERTLNLNSYATGLRSSTSSAARIPGDTS